MRSKFFNKKTIFISMMFIVTLVVTACGGSDEGSDKITVGGKDYTEQVLMVHLVSELVEAETDLEVERKPFLGGTSVVFNALDSGDIDAAVEYTGSGLGAVLDEDLIKDEDELFDRVRDQYDEQFDIKWLDPLGFNNTYALAMRKEKAEELGIEKVSDLEEYAEDFTIASDDEFLERDEDGMDQMLETYDLEFADTKGMDPGLMYGALDEEELDVIVGFSTDGRIPAFDLKILEDDKQFLPPYDAAITVRNDTLEEYPELEDVLNKLSDEFTDEVMAELNAEVDLEEREPDEVAEEWLTENGIIE